MKKTGGKAVALIMSLMMASTVISSMEMLVMAEDTAVTFEEDTERQIPEADIVEGAVSGEAAGESDEKLGEAAVEADEKSEEAAVEAEAPDETVEAAEPGEEASEKEGEVPGGAADVSAAEEQEEAVETSGSSETAEAEAPSAVSDETHSLLIGAPDGQDASSHFHATVTAAKDTYTSGETALVTVKYEIDRGAVSPGDYVYVTIPEDIASSANFSVSPQHFSGVEYLGGGLYKLTFGENAETALSGSMTIRVKTSAETETTDTISTGGGSASITVKPGEETAGTGVPYPIDKDAYGISGVVDYGGWDDDRIQFGFYDSDTTDELGYRVFIKASDFPMTGTITVTDTLPDGLTFKSAAAVVPYGSAHSAGVQVFWWDGSRMYETVPGAAVSIHGQTLTVTVENDGTISTDFAIYYYVNSPVGVDAKYQNHAEVTYTNTNHEVEHAHRDYIAMSQTFKASNGVKSADKTIVSTDPNDQYVTYTIRFWTDNGFEAEAISLTDMLDPYLDFLYANGTANADGSYTDGAFRLTPVKEDGVWKIYIVNTEALPKKQEVSVSFVCDFSRVPVNYTVENTVGGNTTRTTKTGGFRIEAKKGVSVGGTVLYDLADFDRFQFELVDSAGKVMQTVSARNDGSVSFDSLVFEEKDLGKTFSYTLREKIPADSDDYEYDGTTYMVTLMPHLADDGETLEFDTVITSDDGRTLSGGEVPEFVNTYNGTTKIAVSKLWDDEGHEDSRPDSVKLEILADGESMDPKQTVTLTAEDTIEISDGELDGTNKTLPWSKIIGGLPKYKVDDSGNLAEIEYSLAEYEGSQYESSTETMSSLPFPYVIVTNTWKDEPEPEYMEVNVTKVWLYDDGEEMQWPDGSTVEVALLLDGEATGQSATLTADNPSYTFRNLRVYEGKDYSVDETSVSNKEIQDNIDRVVIDGTAKDGYTIRNIMSTEYGNKRYTTVTAKKVWDDGSDKDGIRPESVTVILLADGEEWEEAELSEENHWTVTWEYLSKDMEYTVREVEVEGYTSSVTGNADEGFVITNLHEPTPTPTPTPTPVPEKPSPPGKPTTSTKTNAPVKTGDASPMKELAGLFSLSLAAMFLLLAGRRRSKKN